MTTPDAVSIAAAMRLHRESPEAVMLTDSALELPGPKILFVNQAFCELTGYRPEEVLGHPSDLLEGPHTSRATLSRSREAQEQGEPFQDSVVNYRKDGAEFVADWSLTPIRDEDGQIAQWLSTRRDASEHAHRERAGLANQLLEHQRLESIGLVARGVAHDFNNLLTVVLGNTELLLQELAAPSPLRALVEPLQSASRLGAELCGQLLAYASERPANPEALELNALVRDMATLLEVVVSGRAGLAYDLDASRPVIEGDRTQIRQVLLNLVSNAADASAGRGGTITIATGRAAGLAHLEVRDEGPGIGAAAWDRIFEPFFSTKAGGRGLGLSAALDITQRYGGTLEVVSRRGLGTRFCARFPSEERGLELPPLGAATGQPRRIAGSGWVLVIDEDEGVRDVAARMLRRLGFAAKCYKSLADAIDPMGDKTLRAVIVALSIDEFGAALALQRIRERFPALPLILCSGHGHPSPEETSDGVQPGAMLCKPFSEDDLSSALEAALRSAAERS